MLGISHYHLLQIYLYPFIWIKQLLSLIYSCLVVYVQVRQSMHWNERKHTTSYTHWIQTTIHVRSGTPTHPSHLSHSFRITVIVSIFFLQACGSEFMLRHVTKSLQYHRYGSWFRNRSFWWRENLQPILPKRIDKCLHLPGLWILKSICIKFVHLY